MVYLLQYRLTRQILPSAHARGIIIERGGAKHAPCRDNLLSLHENGDLLHEKLHGYAIDTERLARLLEICPTFLLHEKINRKSLIINEVAFLYYLYFYKRESIYIYHTHTRTHTHTHTKKYKHTFRFVVFNCR